MIKKIQYNRSSILNCAVKIVQQKNISAITNINHETFMWHINLDLTKTIIQNNNNVWIFRLSSINVLRHLNELNIVIQ